MKKIIITIPVTLLFVLILSAFDGPNAWTVSNTSAGPIWGVAWDPVNGNNVYCVSNLTGAYKSTDAGLTWVQLSSGLTNTILQCIDISRSNPDIIMVGSTNTGSNPGVFRSTDGGATWESKSNGITDARNIQGIAIHPTNPNIAMCCTFDGVNNSIVGLFKTTDGGNNWFAANTGVGTIKNFLSIIYNPLNPNVLYAGTSFSTGTPQTGPSAIYRSNDGGTTWFNSSNGLPTLSTEINPVRVLSMANPDTARVLAALFVNTTTGGGGAWLTTNSGQLWTRIHSGLSDAQGTLLRGAVIRPGSSTEFYVGLDGTANPKGVWRTTNAGQTWVDFNGGPVSTGTTVRGMTFKTSIDVTLFASGGATPTGVLQYSFVPVGIHGNGNGIPTSFNLYQNYPNPFNPKTTIIYDLPKASNVEINVFDVNGKLVKSIVNNYQQAGQYTINLDMNDVSSGIYMYKIVAGSFTSTKKMILVK